MNHFTRWSCLLSTLPGLGLHGMMGAEKPLNILVLLTDDWRYNTPGCAGNAVVQTPNLDRLAQQGLRFTHASVTTPICGVSRASLFTGQWMSRHGHDRLQHVQAPMGENVSRTPAHGLADRWSGSKGAPLRNAPAV